ncbi:hypothetical protein [Lentilactobacillus sp. SPB1-3]|uniref:Uncharacterized protein n=1 Tax=Lentilactobacillus terminaliae TaxID=3003483 RepID=A0ACD5DEJ8_9LACO|nr:hypothetical protein [Lentilactobacillus sp. SPB1-3]MCZ0976322.1 hypothetical protein [Lentilactobacillus sp. SPB1-3]
MIIIKSKTAHFFEVAGTLYLIFKLFVWFWPWILTFGYIILVLVGCIAFFAFGISGYYGNGRYNGDGYNSAQEPYRDVYKDEGLYWDEYEHDFRDSYDGIRDDSDPDFHENSDFDDYD